MRAVKNVYYGMWAKSILDVNQGRLKSEGSWQEILIPLVMLGNLLNVISLFLVILLAFELFTDSTFADTGLEFVTKGKLRFLLLALVAPVSFLGVYWLVLRNGRHRQIVRVYGSLCKIKHPLHWYIGVSLLADVALSSVLLLLR